MATNEARTDSTTHATSKRQRGKEMSDNQLTALIGRKVFQAMNDEDGDLSDTRQDSFDRYMGDLYGNERDGYSKFVTREVLETVEWVLPSVLRVFLGSDRVVSYDPVSPEDEEQAEQETDIANHAIMKSNDGDGFLALHHWCKDALMFPNGYIKLVTEDTERVETECYEGLDAISLDDLVSDENVEITSQTSKQVVIDIVDPATGQSAPAPIEVFDVELERTILETKLQLLPVPPEEALVDNDCTSPNIDTADFVCHRVRRSYTDLVNAGYDPDLLDSIGEGEDFQYNDERVNRLFFEDENPDAEDEDDESMRQFWVHDCYIWVDYDGDGVGEFRNVVVIGKTVFVNEPCDLQPMIALSSILIPHKHNGMSVADIVKDLQELNTTLHRQMLDNIYKFNVGRKLISEDALLEDGTTLEAMLNTQAEFIPVRGNPAMASQEESRASIVGEILSVLQHTGEQKQVRTGIAPNLTLDPQVLQQSTGTAFLGALDQASQRIEMLVRIFAETGFKHLFRKVHQAIKQNPDIVRAVKIRGKWVTDQDPASWRDRTSVSVNVGLGFNNREKTVQMLVQLLAMQREAMPAGLADISKIYNTLEEIIEASSLGEPGRYFNDPTAEDFQPPQPQPDPNAVLAQAQAASLQADQQRKAAELQVKAQHDSQKLQYDMQKAQADAEKAQADAAMKMQELRIKERELSHKEAELSHKLDMERAKGVADVDNTNADTALKREQAFKARADAVATAVDADDTVREARDIVKNGNQIEGQSETDAGEDNEAPTE